MAIVANPEKRSAVIVVDNGVSSSGKALTKNITFSGVNPDATPAQIMTCLQAIAGLMDHTVVAFYVNDKEAIVEE